MITYTLSIAETGMEMLQSGIDQWNNWYAKIMTVITTSPESLYPTVWANMKTINQYVAAIGVTLMVIFFYIGLMKNTIHLEELKRPEKFFGLFLRLAVAKGIVTYSFTILIMVMDIFQGTIAGIASAVGINNQAGMLADIPQELMDMTSSVNVWAGIGILALAIIGTIAIWVCSIVMLLYVYMRFFKIYIYAALSPLPLASMAGDGTSKIARSFLESYLGVCFQGVVIAVSMIIFSSIVSAGSNSINASGSATSELFKYIGSILLSLLLLTSLVKTSDHITKEMIGV